MARVRVTDSVWDEVRRAAGSRTIAEFLGDLVTREVVSASGAHGNGPSGPSVADQADLLRLLDRCTALVAGWHAEATECQSALRAIAERLDARGAEGGPQRDAPGRSGYVGHC